MRRTIRRLLTLAVLVAPCAVIFAEVEPRNSREKEVSAERIVERADLFYQSGTRQWNEGNWKLAQVQFDQAIGELLSAPPTLKNRSFVEARYQRMVEDIYRLEADATEAEPSFEESPLEEIIESTFPLDPKLKARVVEQVRATASQLPLELADPVVQFINYFQTEKGSRTLRFGLKRMGRYEPMIRRILDEEGVPQELIHLAQAESAFQPRAMSRAKAGGMWQFIPSRGAEYGLHSSKQHDDRFDPEQATRAAARHLRDLYEQFGDWYLAVAAYNCGPYNVERAVERTGYADFWELYKKNMVPRETSNYVPIILAMTIMAKNASAYGLDDIVADTPVAFDSVTLTAPTHLALVADLTGTPLNDIRELNPAIHKLVAPAGYRLHIPKEAPATMKAALELIPPDRRASWRLHRVGSEETLNAIAKHYNTTPARIAEVNSETIADEMEEGEFVVIPVAYPGAQEAAPAKPAARKAAPKKAKVPVKKTAAKKSTRKAATSAKPAAAPKPAKKRAAKPRPVAEVRQTGRRNS